MDASSGRPARHLRNRASLGSTLLEEARIVLEDFDGEADEVLKDFFDSLLEQRLRFDPGHGYGLPWMCGVVQGIAQQRRREREREEDGESECE